MMSTPDSCIEVLVLRGAMLMAQFIQGEPNPAISWLEVNETASDLPTPVTHLRHQLLLLGGLSTTVVLVGGLLLNMPSSLSSSDGRFHSYGVPSSLLLLLPTSLSSLLIAR
jgi:hypothetical protein